MGYNNIKHALHEPAENELIVLIHFHLKQAIMVGKKRHIDIQFYTELGEANESLDFGRRSMWDPDEIESEQRDKKHKQDMNRRYEKFIKDVENKVSSSHHLEFDIPYNELGFDGVPMKSLVKVKPTVNALVALIEPPYFVMTLDDVEIAYFERVIPGVKNFDLVFVFSDYTRPVQRVTTIPSSKLQEVRNWLDSIDKKYYEGVANLAWPKLMKTIQEDPKGFHEDGGWAGLEEESDEGDGEGDSDDESEYEEDVASSDEEIDESDEELSEHDEDNESDEGDEEDEEEEAGMDWDQLEQEAKRDDKRRAQEEVFESQNERSSKKHKSSHKSSKRRQ